VGYFLWRHSRRLILSGEPSIEGDVMAGQAVTTLQDQDINRLVRAGGGQVVDQVHVTHDGSTVVLLVLASAPPTSASAGVGNAQPSDTATQPVTEPTGRRPALAQRRREVCKTQEVLAVEVGVQRTTVARWESGETTPSLWARPRLANALDVSLDALDSILAVAPSQPRALRVVQSVDAEDSDSETGA
jgi:DNA-binding XRE family transcriptional regulator